jgi:hypothetical protein
MAKKNTEPKCTKVFLEGGTGEGDHKWLNIAPTMKNITHEGRKYFRCMNSRAQDPTDGEWGQMYLWEGWGAWRLKKMEDEEATNA